MPAILRGSGLSSASDGGGNLMERTSAAVAEFSLGVADPFQIEAPARPAPRMLPPDGPHKPILLVDFDGVLHSYASGWKGAAVVADGPVDGAIAWLWEVIAFFDVQIYSSRSRAPGGIDAMRTALKRWDVEHAARYATQGNRFSALLITDYVKFPTEKPAAFLTIDDRAVCFEGIFPPAAALLGFKPWNKR